MTGVLAVAVIVAFVVGGNLARAGHAREALAKARESASKAPGHVGAWFRSVFIAGAALLVLALVVKAYLAARP